MWQDNGNGNETKQIDANDIHDHIENKMFGVRVSRKKAVFESLGNEYSPIPEKIPTIRRKVSIYKRLRKQYLSEETIEIENPETQLADDDKPNGSITNQNTSDNEDNSSLNVDKADTKVHSELY